MKMTLSILAGTLALVSSSAFAIDLSFSAGAIPPAPADYYNQVTHVAGSFSDTYTFTVLNGELLSTANNLQVLNAATPALNPFSSDISSLSYSISQGEQKFGSYSGGLSVAQTMLTAGTYTLQINGIADGTHGGTYGLDLALATPVPEASTYATLLAGLGLIGFATRRRNTRDGKFK